MSIQQANEEDPNSKFVFYNETFLGILFNFLIGAIRIAVYFPCVYFLIGSIAYNAELSFRDWSFTKIYIVIFQTTVLAFIVFDCTTSKGILYGFGDFYDRAVFSRFSHWLGLGGHVGLACFRLLLWSVVVSFEITSATFFNSFGYIVTIVAILHRLLVGTWTITTQTCTSP